MIVFYSILSRIIIVVIRDYEDEHMELCVVGGETI